MVKNTNNYTLTSHGRRGMPKWYSYPAQMPKAHLALIWTDAYRPFGVDFLISLLVCAVLTQTKSCATYVAT